MLDSKEHELEKRIELLEQTAQDLIAAVRVINEALVAVYEYQKIKGSAS